MDECKTCASCRESKGREAFSRSKRRPDGLEPYCKACRAAMHKGLDPRKPDPNRPIPGEGEKVCAKCVTAKPVTEFGKHKKWADGLFPYCRVCKRASDSASHARHKAARSVSARQRYLADPESFKARSRANYAADPEAWKRRAIEWNRANRERRRAIVQASYRRTYAIDPERKREVWRRRYAAIKRGCAVYPFTPAQLTAKVEFWGGLCWICRGPWDAIDHVKPLNKGGPHMLANLRPACTPCNTRKLDRWPYLPAA